MSTELELPTARQIARYGWKRSLPGQGFPAADLEGLEQIAVEIDPRPNLPPILNQLALGSCTSNATATCFRYDSILDKRDCGDLSRLWIYRGERQLEGTLGQGDTGAFGHDAFTVAEHGIPPESDWPYDISTFENEPPAAAKRDQLHYVLNKPVREVPQDVASMKRVLTNSQTIAIGFTVYESFESAAVEKTGIVPLPEHGENILGGHEVLVVGYLQKYPEHALMRNSWGEGWGIGGYFLMPWSYLTSTTLSSDFRTIVRSLGK